MEHQSIPVVVVSMTSAVTRREAIARQLGGHSNQWSFLDAIVPGETEGSSWHETDGTRVSSVMGRPMTKGEHGCALSHLRVYEALVKRQDQAVIVLEDDALLSGDLFQVCEEALKHSQFDVLLLGYSKVSARDLCIRNLTEPMISISNVFGHVIGRAYRERRSGTVGYLVTHEGARKLLAAQGNVVTVADDWPYFRDKGLSIMHARPSVVLEDFISTESSIATDRRLVEKTWKHRFVALRTTGKVIRGFIWLLLLRLKH